MHVSKQLYASPCHLLLVDTHKHCDHAAFEGQPVLLEDGSLMDSARLPPTAVQGSRTTVSADRLMQSIASLPGESHLLSQEWKLVQLSCSTCLPSFSKYMEGLR